MDENAPGSKPSINIEGSVEDSNIVVGDNNIVTNIRNIRRYVFRDSRQVVIVLSTILAVAGGLAGAYWYSKQPRPMTGNFNVAVAEFGERRPDGSLASSAHAAQISDTLFDFLDSEYRASGFGLNIQVEHKNVPLITQDTDAEKLAKRIHADIIIYGRVEPEGDQARFYPRFYVSERQNTQELTGQSELALPIQFSVSQLGTGDQLNTELRTRTAVLFNFTKGLIYFSQKEPDAAIAALDAAISAAESSGQTFRGQEVLYLLEADVQTSVKNYDRANRLLDKALALNPQYARARLARGNIFYAEATDSNFDPALLDKAQAEYSAAYQMPNQPEGAYIPLKAHTLLGNALVVKAQQTRDPVLFKQAIENYTYVTDLYQRTGDSSLRLYASIAYFGLGAAYERQGNAEMAKHSYQQAADLTDDPDFKTRIQQQMAVANVTSDIVPPTVVATPTVTGPVPSAASSQVSNSVAALGAETQSALPTASNTGQSIPAPSPVAPGFIPVTGGEVHVLAAGQAHTCLITPEGAVQCWGSNEFGQLGDGTNKNSNTPVTVAGLEGASTILAGGNHTCVLVGSSVWCWGQNNEGQIGDGTTLDRHKPVEVLTAVANITVGFDYACATMEAGGTRCWGDNSNGQLGDGTTTNRAAPSPAKAFAGFGGLDAGQTQTCALTPEGTILCWGGPTPLTPMAPGGIIPVTGGQPLSLVDIQVNRFGHSVAAVDAQGTPIILDSGQFRLISRAAGVISLDLGIAHGCALLNNGSVECWGANYFGQLGNNSTTDSTEAVSVAGLSAASDLAVGADHACAIVGTNVFNLGIKCWGLNSDGQLGNGTNVDSPVPVDVK